MSGAEKAEVLDKVASSSLPRRKVLCELGVPRSTYYRWLRRKEQQGIEDDVGGSNPPWNKLTSQEIDHILSYFSLSAVILLPPGFKIHARNGPSYWGWPFS